MPSHPPKSWDFGYVSPCPSDSFNGLMMRGEEESEPKTAIRKENYKNLVKPVGFSVNIAQDKREMKDPISVISYILSCFSDLSYYKP